MPFFNHLISHASYSPQDHVATPLFESQSLTVMLIGFEPGQSVPDHPGPAGAFYVIDGQGWISVEGERQEVNSGMLVIAPHGARRSIQAETRLTLLVSRGETL